MRWIWIDRFLEFHSGKSARAVKNLSLAEDYFADHFPGYPVMPAPLILEGLAQTGGILVGQANDFREKVVLAKIPRASFRREVLAGERLVYDVELLHLRPEGASSWAASTPAARTAISRPRRSSPKPRSSSPTSTGRARSSCSAR
jgi:3-hydroxyacyl-[acyl-carrier-protein] dehydratase